jgi:hypothetical protein
MRAKTNFKRPDRVILFEIGIILALLLVNYVMEIQYKTQFIAQPTSTTIFNDKAYIYNAETNALPLNQEISKKEPETVKAIYFDPTAYIIPVADIFKNVETTLTRTSFPILAKKSLPSLPTLIDTMANNINTWAQIMPQFPGGEEELYKYITSNFEIPERLYDVASQVELVVQFVVTHKGQVTDVKVIKCSHPNMGAEREARRLYAKMPLWQPGKNGEDPTNVRLIQPVKLKLYH